MAFTFLPTGSAPASPSVADAGNASGGGFNFLPTAQSAPAQASAVAPSVGGGMPPSVSPHGLIGEFKSMVAKIPGEISGFLNEHLGPGTLNPNLELRREAHAGKAPTLAEAKSNLLKGTGEALKFGSLIVPGAPEIRGAGVLAKYATNAIARGALSGVIGGAESGALYGAGEVAQGKPLGQAALTAGEIAAAGGLLGAAVPAIKAAVTPAFAKMLNIGKKAAAENETVQAGLQTWDKVKSTAETSLFEELNPIKEAENELVKLQPEKSSAMFDEAGNLKPRQSPYTSAWMALRGAASQAEAFVNKGLRLSADGTKVNKVAPGLDEILAPIKDQTKDFDDYLLARRAVEVHGQGKNPGMSLEDAQATVARLDSPVFQQQAAKIHQYQNALLQDLVDHGLLTKDAAKTMQELNKEYVPLYRVLDDSKFGGPGTGQRLAPNAPIRRLKGSEREVKSPLASIVKNTYAMISAAERNDVIRAFDNLSKDIAGADKIIKRVKPQYAPTNVTGAEIKKILKEQGIDADIPAKAADAVATIFRPMYRGSEAERTLIAVIDGKRQVFQVSSHALYDALTSYNKQQATWLWNLLARPAAALRAGATLNPNFALRNPFRDAWSAVVYSKYGLRGTDFLGAIAHVLKKDDLYQQWLASGGGHAIMATMDRDQARAIDRATAALNAINPVNALRALSGTTEKFARVAEFAKGLESGATPFEAGLASRDITLDFARSGTAVRTYNRITPFFNAALQGASKLARAARANPREFAARGATYITMPTIGLYMYNRNNPEYQALPVWKKAAFWWVPNGSGGLIPVPKPFELGYVFGTLPEALLSYLDKQDPHALDLVVQGFKQAFVPNLAPTVFLAPLEWKANYSFFKGRAIVPEGDQYKLPADQFEPYTTETAKALGRAFGESPEKIENAVSDVFGGLGRQGLHLSDTLLKYAGATNPPVQPFYGPGLPLAGSFYPQRPIEEGQSQDIDDFYNAKNEAQAEYNSAKLHGRLTGQVHARYTQMNRYARWISKLRDERNAILESRTMSADQKGSAIRYLNVRITNLARAALGRPPVTVNGNK